MVYLLALFQHFLDILNRRKFRKAGVYRSRRLADTVRVRPEEVTWELLLGMAYADGVCFFNETGKSAEDTMGYVVQALNAFG